ncbi:MAG: hypothetical protein AAF213_02295 [Pseudomonadota bacterium]
MSQRSTSSRSSKKTKPAGKRRGRRIPQTAWPGILQQYQRGATLTAIAKEFDCTPSAISYIVNKAEEIYGDLTTSDHLPVPIRRTTGSITNPSQLRPQSDSDMAGDNCSTARPIMQPVDELEGRLREEATNLADAYRAWVETGDEARKTSAAVTLSGQLHTIRRSLAKLEIILSKQGMETQAPAPQTNAPRSRYSAGWQAS